LVSYPINSVARLQAGDYVELDAEQNSGGDLKVIDNSEKSPEFEMTWLAPGP
jgi:hypothetical protein